MKRHNGYTLIEILIALFVFSIFGVITASVINNMAITKQSSNQNFSQLDKLQFTTALLNQDFMQIIDRKISISQTKNEPALTGNHQEITFSRMGNINPNAIEARSSLSRVHYYLANGCLMRTSSFTLDKANDKAPKNKSCVLSQVNEITLTYVDSNLHQNPLWQNNALPKAINLTIKHQQLGDLTFFYPLPQSFKIIKKIKPNV